MNNTLADHFLHLRRCLEALEQTLATSLLWSVVEAQPDPETGHALVDKYDEATTEMLGMLAAARTAVQQAGTVPNPGDARRALITCQAHYMQLARAFYQRPVSVEWITALNNVAQEKGGAWLAWVSGVQDALQQCPEAIYAVEEALFTCWQSLTASWQQPAVAQAVNQEFSIYLSGDEPIEP